MGAEKFDYKKFRSEIFLKYGVELDEISAFILFVLQNEQRVEFAEHNRKMEYAANKIDDSGRTLSLDHNHPRWQAFWFGMGNLGAALIFISVLIFMGLGYYYHSSKNFEKREKMLNWYKTYHDKSIGNSRVDFMNFVKNTPIPQ